MLSEEIFEWPISMTRYMQDIHRSVGSTPQLGGMYQDSFHGENYIFMETGGALCPPGTIAYVYE